MVDFSAKNSTNLSCGANDCENEYIGKACAFCHWNVKSDSRIYNLYSSGANDEKHPCDTIGYHKYAKIK